MFTKFKVDSKAIHQLSERCGRIDLIDKTKSEKSFYYDILNVATGNEDIINGTKLQHLDFPSMKKEYDVFISYSHSDENDALYLASWLNNHCRLTCFLDSIVWHSADALLKVIDDKYCWQPDSGTYSYKKRNYSTSHVHAMLSMAMHDIINRSECCIVIDSDKSFPLKEGIEKCTLSPWIYEEIAFMTHMRPKLPSRYKNLFSMRLFSTGGQLCEAHNVQQVKIKYNVDLDMFPSLCGDDIYSLHDGYNALERLYISKQVFSEVHG